MFCDFWAYFEKCHFLGKDCLRYFLGKLLEKLGYVLFQHHVTLN